MIIFNNISADFVLKTADVLLKMVIILSEQSIASTVFLKWTDFSKLKCFFRNCLNPLCYKLAHHSLQACQMRRFHFKLNGAIFWPLYSFWTEKISRSRKNATTVILRFGNTFFRKNIMITFDTKIIFFIHFLEKALKNTLVFSLVTLERKNLASLTSLSILISDKLTTLSL